LTFRSEISQGIARRCVGNFCVDQKEKSARLAKRRAFSATSTLATAWSYLGNTGDRRLAGIANTGLTTGQFSNFTYTTTPENFISGITESSDAPAVYLASGSQTATYNNLNQLTNLSGQALTFDANGNLTADGQRTYAWDAENRLVGIAYPGVSGKATAFTYDGLGRRSTISSTPPGGGSAAVTSYLWCGDDICQARDAGNSTIRSYYDEGEYLPGTPAQTLYYGIDQIGSVRRVFATTTSATAYGYDPYGVPLQATAPTTDFVYAGMFFNADSGLNLTKNRIFDPAAGRWLSRDWLGEETDPAGNLYPYASGNPISYTDPKGNQAEAIGGAIICPECLVAIGAGVLGWAIYQQLQPEKPAPICMEKSPEITPDDLTGKSKDEIDQMAKDKGLVQDPKKPNKYKDPVTGKERLRVDPGHIDPKTGKPYNDPNAAVPHVHGYPEGGPKAGKIVDPNTGNPHFPLRP
jgi:RHS repeat-associated protein